MEQRFDTLKIHGGYDPFEHHRASVVPIYQTAAYSLEDTYHADKQFAFAEEGPVYSRLANPTVSVLEERMKALHGGSGAIAMASGMAAVSTTLLNVAGKGGRILTTANLYGGSVDCLATLLPQMGVEVDFVEKGNDADEFEEKITENTKAIYIETVTNPFAEIPDIQGIADLAHKHGIPLIVDNTMATPYLINPFDFGVDIAVYSATKGLSGHGDALAGIVVESGKFDFGKEKYPQFYEPLWILKDEKEHMRSVKDLFPKDPFTGRLRVLYLNYLGAVLAPMSAYLIMLGMETLSERLDKQVSNTRKVVAYLEKNPHVEWVRYPSAEGSPFKERAAKYFPKGAGAIFSFGFKGTEEERRKFLVSTKVLKYASNIGDARSLIINPTQTTHLELTKEQQGQVGLTDNTIRLSIGLEDPQDLIEDLDQAFQCTFGK